MTARTQTPAVALAGQLCRPQRIGVFGHRGVGKTTLLTMLYREAVSGRLPSLRLAAADARTADYLSDKILQLEAGQALPATLGETELRFHLYRGGTRLELVVKDYQGEHVALGRQEPIRDFLRDCDAVWLCLDAGLVAAPGPTLHAEQEVEQLVEDYLAQEPGGAPHRPMALVLTKGDLLPGREGEAPAEPLTTRRGGSHALPGDGSPDLGGEDAALEALVQRSFGMTRHALESHCPRRGLFAVSSLGGPIETTPFVPKPSGLDGPLNWLLDTLQAQDEARLERLWEMAGHDLGLLTRCVACFVRRYPIAPASAAFRRRLTELRRRRIRRRGLVGFAAAACLLLGCWTYDAAGEYRARQFEAANESDPAAVRERWQSFQTWHPTRHLFRPGDSRAEEERLRALDEAIRARRCEERLAEVRRRAADPDANPEEVWRQFQEFRADFPEQDVDGDLRQFRAALKGRRDAERERRARDAYDELLRAEQKAELEAQADRAGRFLSEYAGTSYETDVRRRRAAALARLEERDFETARAYSLRNPLNFHSRREHYQNYLDWHPGGAFAKEAAAALDAIESDWDKNDFRAVRDHFQQKPGDVQSLQALCRSYLVVHPQGRFRDATHDLLRWTERVTAPGEYKVVLKNGDFEKGIAPFFSRGAKLSVEIEVNGIRHGPSNIVKNSYDPEWNYEFPRRVRWKLGDSVRIRVTDNNYWGKVIADVSSDDNDRLALRMLCGDVQTPKGRVTFESDFALPSLPKIE
jgi:hypothetical protein